MGLAQGTASTEPRNPRMTDVMLFRPATNVLYSVSDGAQHWQPMHDVPQIRLKWSALGRAGAWDGAAATSAGGRASRGNSTIHSACYVY